MADDPNQLEQVFRAAVLASFADGKPGAEELKLLGELLALYPDFSRVKKARELVVETYQLIKQHGAEALLDQIAAGLPDRQYQELAFTLASKIVSADGTTESGEAMMLGELQERFGFTPEDVLRLLAS